MRVVQAQPPADQPRRSRDTAAVSPTPLAKARRFYVSTTLLLSMSWSKVHPAGAVVAACIVSFSLLLARAAEPARCFGLFLSEISIYPHFPLLNLLKNSL